MQLFKLCSSAFLAFVLFQHRFLEIFRAAADKGKVGWRRHLLPKKAAAQKVENKWPEFKCPEAQRSGKKRRDQNMGHKLVPLFPEPEKAHPHDIPVVLDVVGGHGGVGDPVVDDGVDAHRDRVSGEDLFVFEEKKKHKINSILDRRRRYCVCSPLEEARRTTRFASRPFCRCRRRA